MDQHHTLILWKGAKPMSNDEVIDIAYRTLSVLVNYGEELAPRYRTVRRKRDARSFDFTKENLGKIILNGLTRERKYSEELGTTIGFFSSLVEGASSGILCTLGTSSPLFSDSLIVHLPRSKFSGLSGRRAEFISMFKDLVDVFQPYYAFVCNGSNHVNEEYWETKPTYVHWLNYYDNDTIAKIGKRRIASLSNVEKTAGGCFFQLQEEPIDIGNPAHLALQLKVSKQLKLL